MKQGTIFTAHHRLTGPVQYIYMGDDPEGWDTTYRYKVQNIKTGEICHVDALWFKVRQVKFSV